MKKELWSLMKKLKPHITYFLLREWTLHNLQSCSTYLDREFSYNSYVIQESFLKLGKSFICTWHTILAKQFTVWNGPNGRYYHALKH